MVIAAPNPNVTNYVWAADVLGRAGLPATANNVLNVTRWMVSEEPASNWYHANNPLNINAAGAGFDQFPSLSASAAETARYLGMPNYTGIRAALAADSPFPTFQSAVVASPWASDHYGGALFSGTPPVVSDAGATLTPGTAGLTSIDTPTQVPNPATDPRQCGYVKPGGSPSGIGIPLGGGRIFTRCQVKGIVGGLLVGAGGIMLVMGAFMLAGRSGSLRSAAGAAVGGIAGGPAGAAAGASVGRATAPTRAAVSAPAVEAPAGVAEPADEYTYDDGFLAGISAALDAGPPPKNTRQANRQAESLFDELGISSPGPATQRNSLGTDLPF